MAIGFADFVGRLKNIKPVSDDFDATEEDVLLVRDYFRRVTTLSREFNGWQGGPFFDPLRLLEKDLRADVEKTVSEFVSVCSQTNAYVKRVLIDAARWRALAEQGESIPAHHVDLYEPLIVLFEKGCGFGLHHGELLVGGFAIPLQNWRGDSEAAAESC